MCSRHQPEAGADSATLPRQGADGTAHLMYFDVRTQASFVWDGESDSIEVSIGGYGEPVDHTIQAMNADISSVLVEFGRLCQVEADTLSTYGESN